jgi:5-methyltetrahydropteroyltriglutamate--homocysteine methyltransferase
MSHQFATTHTGSLPRPAELTELLVRRDRGEAVADLATPISQAVRELVVHQIEAGITVVNDGEASKINYASYVKERFDGFGGASVPRRVSRDQLDFPDYMERIFGTVGVERPACIGPVRRRDAEAVQIDIANLKAAIDRAGVDDAFLGAASPGIIAGYLQNQHYSTHEEYIWALADAMKPEYDAVAASGLLLQLDCPDLTNPVREPGDPFEQTVALHIEALNHATRDIPPERMRLHVCWGNYEGPHTQDVPLGDLVELVLRARPAVLSFEAANPRHAHEWRVFEDVALPDGKILMPGVIDSTTNYIEHPQLVADRITTYARIVGADRVIAGTDCGFATSANHNMVDPEIAWAKLRTLAEGAQLAASQLASSRSVHRKGR